MRVIETIIKPIGKGFTEINYAEISFGKKMKGTSIRVYICLLTIEQGTNMPWVTFASYRWPVWLGLGNQTLLNIDFPLESYRLRIWKGQSYDNL